MSKVRGEPITLNNYNGINFYRVSRTTRCKTTSPPSSSPPATTRDLHTTTHCSTVPTTWLAWGEIVQSICCQWGWRVFWWLDDWGSLHQWQWGECWSLVDWNHSWDTQEAQTFWNYKQMQLCSMNSCVEHTPLISHLLFALTAVALGFASPDLRLFFFSLQKVLLELCNHLLTGL